ncbi:hypothetical protein [Sulfitobacter sp.]|uniref:hypothetical protein n=1 Tax=Sulfitobacter sp. TaxID=1903071 RepID=UPI003EF8CE35
MPNFPTPLLNLLNWKNVSLKIEATSATILDWLTINELTALQCQQYLEVGSDTIRRIEHPEQSAFDVIETEVAWQQTADAFLLSLPSLAEEIRQVCDCAPKCLADKSEKIPQAFTYDLGEDTLPFVSVPYQGRPFDLLAMAHEFGHALQIVSSKNSKMPPVARECCAFLGEVFLLDYLKRIETSQTIGVSAAWEHDNHTYLKPDMEDLCRSLMTVTAPYNYRWNYPVARVLATKLVSEKSEDIFAKLFKAGAAAPKILADAYDSFRE